MVSDPCRPASLCARTPARGDGFTLIEVLIAIVVVGILTAIALPQYTLYVQRSRVVDATSLMNDIRTRQEQFFQDTLSYFNAGACGAPMPPSPYFTFTCVAGPVPNLSYVVTAQGIGSMALFRYTITVDPTPLGVGVVRATATVPPSWNPLPAGNCWQIRPGGYC
jgi:type IV pilus assembly protein PilE